MRLSSTPRAAIRSASLFVQKKSIELSREIHFPHVQSSHVKMEQLSVTVRCTSAHACQEDRHASQSIVYTVQGVHSIALLALPVTEEELFLLCSLRWPLPIAEYYASRNRKQLLTTSKRVEGRASGDQQRQSESEEDGVDQDGERNASMPGRKWRREKQMKQRCKR